MEKIHLNISERYYCAYLPTPRSQKYAFDEVTGDISVTVLSATAEEAPVAFRLNDYSHRSEGQTELRWFDKRLWKRCTRREGGEIVYLTAEDIKREMRPGLPCGRTRNRQVVTRKYQQEARRFLIIDGELWQQSGEPRYVVNTFGLGHNHGGTGMFVEEFYNSNIPNKNYFSAIDGDLAVAYANRVAERRGDTDDVGKFEKMIEVLIPEAVTIRPMDEHGDGDPFINKINAITEVAPDATTAGLLAMMTAFKDN